MHAATRKNKVATCAVLKNQLKWRTKKMTIYETHDCELKNESACEEEIDEDGAGFDFEESE